MVVCVDFSNIFFISFSMFKKQLFEKNGADYVIQEEDLGLFYHMIITKAMDYLTNFKQVIFCWEGKYSTAWRKKIYPPYKENRVRNEDPNYKWVGPLMEKMLEFLSLFECKTLKVDNCEGDDCIYQTCKYYAEKGESVKIVSNDKDLSQIINFYPELVSQYNPIKKCEIERNENILIEKALIGDTSDNIKAFKGIGPKTFEKMMSDKLFYAKHMTPDNLKMLDIVMQIIDLRKFPQEYQNAIKEELDKPWNKFDVQGIEKFFLDNSLKVCYNDWTNKWYSAIQEQHMEQPDAIDEIMEILQS